MCSCCGYWFGKLINFDAPVKLYMTFGPRCKSIIFASNLACNKDWYAFCPATGRPVIYQPASFIRLYRLTQCAAIRSAFTAKANDCHALYSIDRNSTISHKIWHFSLTWKNKWRDLLIRGLMNWKFFLKMWLLNIEHIFLSESISAQHWWQSYCRAKFYRKVIP